MHYALVFMLFLVGLYGVVVKRNLIKIIVSLVIMETAINVFIIMIGYKADGMAPIMDQTMATEIFIRRSVDPLPQALVLTAIVIGLGVTAMTVSIAMRLHQRYGTYDVREIRRLKG
jgi:multicomponent Na+:H+ antiporter subunit C